MTESNKENVPPADDEASDAVTDRSLEITNAIMSGGQWGNVEGSSLVPQANGMWELRIRFNNGTTRRVRIGSDGGVTSDQTGPTVVLQ